MRYAGGSTRPLTVETSVPFPRGHMYFSPPVFMPGLEERYRLIR